MTNSENPRGPRVRAVADAVVAAYVHEISDRHRRPRRELWKSRASGSDRRQRLGLLGRGAERTPPRAARDVAQALAAGTGV